MLMFLDGAVQRMQDRWEERETHNVINTSFLADLDHRPRRGSTCGCDFPTVLAHGTTMDLSDPHGWCMALANENVQATGQRMYTGAGSAGAKVSRMRKNLALLPPRQRNMIAGNGMRLITQDAGLLYVLSSVVSVGYCESLSRPPQTQSDIEEGENHQRAKQHRVMQQRVKKQIC